RERDLDEGRCVGGPAVRGGIRDGPGPDHGHVSVAGEARRRVRGAVGGRGDVGSRAGRLLLGAMTWLVLAFLYVPLAIVVVYAFNTSRIQTWPPSGFTVHWFSVAWQNREVRSALWLSIQAGLGATAIALALGSAAAFAVHKFR